MGYEYKMVPIPRTMAIKAGEDMSKAIADYLSKLVNDMSGEGWEFYRADEYAMASIPGCLAALCGQKESYESYNVACFRKQQ